MNINELKLRRQFIAHPDMVRKIVLTDHQVGIVKYIRDSSEPMTAAELAALRKISVQNASRQLVNLWLRGYLDRKQVADETGGIYYAYKTAI